MSETINLSKDDGYDKKQNGKSLLARGPRTCGPDGVRASGLIRNAGGRDGVTSEERDRIKALEREVRELRQANEILRKASAYFAQAELDRPLKR